MGDGSDDVFVDVFVVTRRQLRGVAESLIAGPQHRASGTIRLAVRPDGFTGSVLPVAVHGTELLWPQGSAPLCGPVSALADAAGLHAGPPAGVYDIIDPLAADAVLDIDADAAERIYRSLYAGGHALKATAPEQHPVLWPEHFDVAVTEDEVNYGVSAGDSYHPMPYAYVHPPAIPAGPFWNAPFGALYALDKAADVDALTGSIAEFFGRARSQLPIDSDARR
jgi:hypothetical protein